MELIQAEVEIQGSVTLDSLAAAVCKQKNLPAVTVQEVISIEENGGSTKVKLFFTQVSPDWTLLSNKGVWRR